MFVLRQAQYEREISNGFETHTIRPELVEG